MWRPKVRFSNLLLGLPSNISAKPLFFHSNTGERNIKGSFLFILSCGGMQGICWLTDLWRIGYLLFSNLLSHNLVSRKSSDTSLCYAWIFAAALPWPEFLLCQKEWWKRKKSKVRRNVLHLNQGSQMQAHAYHHRLKALSLLGWIL